MKRENLILMCAAALTLISCGTSKWADESRWFDCGKSVNESYADVFYITSTNVIDEKDESGKDAYIAKLTDSEREAMGGEMAYMREMFGDSLNFFAPYYEQFTLSALALDHKNYMKARKKALKKAAAAFDYYLRHANNGRPFILAGFSQGGMHLVDIMHKIGKKDYEHMITAYSIGYRISEDDLSHPYLKAAQDADDLGTIVSFNSVASTDAIWPTTTEGAATCINPISFSTDEEPVTKIYNDDTLTVRVDKQHNVLMVNSPKISTYRFPILDDFCKPGNLHHWDILFYRDDIHNNAMKRVRKYREGAQKK